MKRRGFLGAILGTGAALTAAKALKSEVKAAEPEKIGPKPERYPVAIEPPLDGYEEVRWLEPVETTKDLPKKAAEGSAICVMEDECSYIATADGWTMWWKVETFANTQHMIL